MHFCFLNMAIEFYSPVSGGAVSTAIMNSARELLLRGHRVTVLTRVNDDPGYDVGEVVPLAFPAGNGDAKRGLLTRAWTVLRQHLAGWEWTEYGAYRRAFLAALDTLPEPPDALLVCNDLVSPRYLKRRLPGTRTVVWLHNECRPRHRFRADAGLTDVFLTCSGYVRDWAIRTLRLPPAKVRVAPNGVDLGTFIAAGRLPAAADAPLRVLFVGRIDRNKGPDLAADAVATLRAEGLDVRLTVAGGLWFYGHGREAEDPFFCELQGKLAAVRGTYLGHVPRGRLPMVMREHDVVCVLSRSREPFGLVVLEAMACGCAVIASDRGGLPEAGGGAALLVNPEDPAAVAGCLRALATDRAALHHHQEQSLRRAATASWANCADALEAAVGSPDARETTLASSAPTPDRRSKPAGVGHAHFSL